MPPLLPPPPPPPPRRLAGLARSLGLGLRRLLPWVPAYVLFADNVASLERVSGGSMSPTFCPEGSGRDWIVATRWRSAEGLRRGQVVLYRSPIDPERQVIKRVVALEGDVVRSRVPPRSVAVVPRAHAWMEGDEPFRSVDSNFYGPVPLALVTARATHVVWPPHRVGAVAVDEGAVRSGALLARARE